jgi:DNA-binding transcriptional LysR family regulator
VEAAQRLLGRAALYWCDRPVFRTVLDELLAAGLRPARVIACGDLELVKSLALDGGCAALLPARVARYGHPGRLRPVAAGLPRHVDTIHLIYRGDLPRTRAARRVREALLERGRELDLEE